MQLCCVATSWQYLSAGSTKTVALFSHLPLAEKIFSGLVGATPFNNSSCPLLYYVVALQPGSVATSWQDLMAGSTKN
jgi:hypothetical protein